MNLDILLWLIIAAFLTWEAYAHFVGKNKEAHTLSNRIQTAEARHPILRVFVAAAMLVLTIHLLGAF